MSVTVNKCCESNSRVQFLADEPLWCYHSIIEFICQWNLSFGKCGPSRYSMWNGLAKKPKYTTLDIVPMELHTRLDLQVNFCIKLWLYKFWGSRGHVFMVQLKICNWIKIDRFAVTKPKNVWKQSLEFAFRCTTHQHNTQAINIKSRLSLFS